MTEGQSPRVLVLGSVHVDLIASAARLPGTGESVTGGIFTMAPGGKAGNQACQLARLGIHVEVVSRLGDDLFGHYLLDSLRDQRVGTSQIVIDPAAATGASTVLAGSGDYQSIIAPGAAGLVTRDDVANAFERSGPFDAFITQFELPLGLAIDAVALAHEHGAMVVLNASPLVDGLTSIPATAWEVIDVLIVNRVEAAALIGCETGASTAPELAVRLREYVGIETILVTAGSQGAAAATADGVFLQPAYPANVIDTVGAGDAFLGAFVAARLQGCTLARALDRGAAAGSLAVRRRGAYGAMPTGEEIDRVCGHPA